jgi:hypothetical protein
MRAKTKKQMERARRILKRTLLAKPATEKDVLFSESKYDDALTAIKATLEKPVAFPITGTEILKRKESQPGSTFDQASRELYSEKIYDAKMKARGVSEHQSRKAKGPRPKEFNDLIKEMLDENPQLTAQGVFNKLKRSAKEDYGILIKEDQAGTGEIEIEFRDSYNEPHSYYKSGLRSRIARIRKENPHLKKGKRKTS